MARAYDRPRLATGRIEGVQSSGPVVTSPQGAQVTESLGSRALQALLNFGGQLAEQALETRVQDEYMRGQRARMQGVAADAVEGNALTRPFIRAGYEAQDYRLAQSELMLKMQTFLKSEAGASLTPEQFATVLQSESENVVNMIGPNLNVRDRAKALQQQVESEETLLMLHADLHQKYGVQQYAKRLTTQGNEINATLGTARAEGNDAAYMAARRRGAQYFLDILDSDTLPTEMKDAVATNFLLSVAGAGNHELVTDLRDSGMLDNLDFQSRTRLDSGIRDAQGRTSALDNIGVYEGKAQFMLALAGGEVTRDSVVDFVEGEVQAGREGANWAEEVYKLYYKSASNKDGVRQTLAALGAGNIDALDAMGVSREEALQTLDQNLAQQGIPLAQRVQTGLRIGLQVGHVPNSVGANVAAAITALNTADPEQQAMHPGQAELLSNVLVELKTQQETHPSAAGTLLAALPEQARSLMAYALQQAEYDVAPDQALQQAAAKTAEFQTWQDFQKVAEGAKFRTEMSEAVESAFGRGNIGNLWRWVTGQPRRADDAWDVQNVDIHVRAEVQRLANDPANVAMLRGDKRANEALIQAAIGNVRERTVLVGKPNRFGRSEDETALILPRGQTVQSLYGAGITPERLGRTLFDLYPSEPGARSSFRMRMDGRLENLQIEDSTGRVLRETVIDQDQLSTLMQQDLEKVQAEQVAANFGKPVEVRDGDTKHKLNVSGGNTAGLGVRDVYNWRRSLLREEGFRLTAYEDRDDSGNVVGIAVGAGQNVTGQLKAGDQITLEQASDWFQTSSDAALNAGSRIARRYGVVDEGAILALAGATYQLGEQGLRDFRKAGQAIEDRDWAAFQREVRDSKWYRQTPARVDRFIRAMRPHFRDFGNAPIAGAVPIP